MKHSVFGKVKKVRYSIHTTSYIGVNCVVSVLMAPAMIGVLYGLVHRIKEELRNRQLNPDIVTAVHYFIHPENLCAKSLKFSHVIQPIIEGVNCTRYALLTISFASSWMS